MNQRLTDIRRAQLDQLLSGDTNMAGGGLLKSVAKAVKAAKPTLKAVQDVLPAAERDANLAKFLAESKTPMRLYHGTQATEGGKGQEAISRIKPSKEGALGSGVYLTPSSAHASGYSGIPNDEALNMMLSDPRNQDFGLKALNQRNSGNVLPSQQGGNMLPVHAQIKNPLIIEGQPGRYSDPMIEALTKLGMDEDKATRMVERAYEQKGYIGKEVESRARAAGYDGLAQYRNGELSEVVAFDPNTVKSAIGNRGTYDTNEPDLNKAGGGSVSQPAAQIDGNDFVEAAKAYGLNIDNATLNKIVARVNKGESVREAARNVAQSHAGGGLLKAAVKAAKPAAKAVTKAAELALEIRPPSDNIRTVRESNFTHSRLVGNQNVKIGDLSGGVRLSDPQEKKRVKDLADKISSPDGYISRIIVDQDNNVIEGQHRLEALRQLGVQDVPVYKIEDLEATMPVDKMKSAMSAVGPIHSDHVNQLVDNALEHISEGGMDNARKMNYGKFQKHYDAALDAAVGMQKVLPAAERDANLAKMLEGSAVQSQLYHGTGRDIQEFDKSKLRRTAFGDGFHLAESPNLANFYANQFDEGQNVMPVHAAIKKPYELKNMHDWYDIPGNNDKEKTNFLKSQGYDGIKYPHGAGGDPTSPSPNVYVAFEPEQIKSATGNRGTYDLSSPDINKAQGGLVHLAGGGDPRKRGLFPKMSMQAIVDSPGFDPTVPDAFGNAYQRRISEKEKYERETKDQKLTPANRVVAGLEAAGMIGSALFEGVQQFPKLIDGEEAYNKAVGERMYQPRFQPEKAAEYVGNVGDFLEKLETEYKIPQIVPELIPFIGAAEAAKQQSKRAVKQGALTAASRMDAGPKAGSMAAQRGAVKLGGGNWVDTEVKRRLKKLKQDDSYPESFVKSIKEDLAGYEGQPQYADDVDIMRRDLAHMEQTNAFNKWVDTKAGSYVRNQMATPDDPVVKMLDVRAAKIEADYQAGQKRLAKLDERIAQAPTSTTEEQNTLANLKRTRSQRAAEIESDRDLAMNSMLPGGEDFHGYEINTNDIGYYRKKYGFPEEGYAKSLPGQAWEAAVDSSTNINSASNFQGQAENIAASKAADKALRDFVNLELPEMAKKVLDERIDMTEQEKEKLLQTIGRQSIINIAGQDANLRNKELMDAADKAREKVSMASYSMAEDNPYLANLPPETPVYNALGIQDLGIDHIIDVLKDDVATGKLKLEDLNKITMDQAVKRAAEYDFEMAKKARDAVAQSRATMPVYKEYPEGYKWVQLTKPGDFNAESNSMGHSVRGYEPEKGDPDWTPESGDSGRSDYGHGGWEAIKSGKAKVYSLVDPSGKPHTTIEVKTKGVLTDDDFGANDARIVEGRGDFGERGYRTTDNQFFEGYADAVAHEKIIQKPTAQELQEPPSITQIKGKGNSRPAEKYDQYTQDFVRSGNWGDVNRNDLRNTGLIEHSGKYFTEPEFVEAAKKYGRMGVHNTTWETSKQRHIDAGVPEEEALLNWVEAFKDGRGTLDIPDEPNMAGGGSVGLKNALNNLLRTDKPEVHMVLGGATNRAKIAAKAAEKAAKAAAKVEHPLVFPRAVPKSLEEIRPIAQRMAEQMTGDFVKQNPKVTTNPAGKSRKQFEREKSIPLETRNVVPERAAPEVNYEDYMGYGLVGVPGDPTLGGVAKRGSLEEVAQPTVELTRVGDITPDYPVPLFGGPRYGDDEKFWASNFGAAVPIQKNASKLADEYQSPIIAKYIKMGSGSENFALHNLDALLAIQRPERLDKAKMAQLTEVIQAGSPKYGKFPDFTGFEEPIDVLLQAQMDSNLRKHIAETLTKPTITNELGLPNGLDVVAAITHPELRNLETGASGFSVGKMKPGAKLQRGESSHPTYDTDIPGSFLGRSKYPTPYEIAFPDTTAYARSQMTPGVQEFNMMKLLGPRERIDQQYIDEIKMYEQLMKQYTGKKKGGLAQTKKVKRHGNTVPH